MEDIVYLGESRYYTEVFDLEIVAKSLDTSVERVSRLNNSSLASSIRIKEAVSFSDKDFEEFLNKRQINENNLDLVEKLKRSRKNFAGIGTNKVKRYLNTLTDPVMKAIRIALEIEDKNISARSSRGKYKQYAYKDKQELIDRLVELFQQQGWVFGTHKSQNPSTTHVIFFDIPGVEQLSWHVNTDGTLPVYPGKWDKRFDTLEKMERFIKKVIDAKDN